MRQGLYLNLQPADTERLAGQQAPRILAASPSTGNTGGGHRLGAGNLNSRPYPHLAGSLPAELSLRPTKDNALKLVKDVAVQKKPIILLKGSSYIAVGPIVKACEWHLQFHLDQNTCEIILLFSTREIKNQ